METVDIYCRVSTTEQAQEGYSLGEQEDRLRKYADAHNWVVNRVLIDGGYSGASMDRPGLQQLLQDATNKCVNKVLVYKLDRLSRSQKDTLYIIEDILLKNQVDFVSMTETLDTSTPFGLAMIGILSVFAQLERETIKERMWGGIEASVRDGKLGCGAGGNIPIGYRKDGSNLVIDDYEAMIVKMVFERYTRRECVADIWKDMNERFPVRNAEWSAWRVTEILQQPLYVGLQKWHDDLVPCTDVPKILPMDIWQRAQDIRASRTRSTRPQSNHKHVCLLGGIMYCGVCGARIQHYSVKSRDKRYNYYACVNRRPSKTCAERPECDLPFFKEEELNERVIESVKSLSVEDAVLSRKKESSNLVRLEDLQKEIDSIKRKQRRLMDLYASEDIDFEAINDALKPLSEKLKVLNAEKEKVEELIYDRSIESFQSGLMEFKNIVEDCEDKMILYPAIHELISDIVVSADSMAINWNI